jgi:hypothetical protein
VTGKTDRITNDASSPYLAVGSIAVNTDRSTGRKLSDRTSRRDMLRRYTAHGTQGYAKTVRRTVERGNEYGDDKSNEGGIDEDKKRRRCGIPSRRNSAGTLIRSVSLNLKWGGMMPAAKRRGGVVTYL